MAAYKRYRKEDSVSYSLGITLTFELLKFKTEYVNRVFVHSAMKQGDTLDKLLKLCKDSDIEVVYADKIFNVLSQKDNCYVIGEFRKFESGLDKDSSHIVLVNPSNAGNMGTIMRSALGFGMNRMAIIRPAVDAFDPKVVRASMGAIFSTEFVYFDSFDEYMKKYTFHFTFSFVFVCLSNLCACIGCVSAYSNWIIFFAYEFVNRFYVSGYNSENATNSPVKFYTISL